MQYDIWNLLGIVFDKGIDVSQNLVTILDIVQKPNVLKRNSTHYSSALEYNMAVTDTKSSRCLKHHSSHNGGNGDNHTHVTGMTRLFLWQPWLQNMLAPQNIQDPKCICSWTGMCKVCNCL